jgi:hypothetical protein
MEAPTPLARQTFPTANSIDKKSTMKAKEGKVLEVNL